MFGIRKAANEGKQQKPSQRRFQGMSYKMNDYLRLKQQLEFPLLYEGKQTEEI